MATNKTENNAAAQAAAPATETYVVVSPLNHDGVDHAPGAEVDLTAGQAGPLLGHTVRPKAEAQAAETTE